MTTNIEDAIGLPFTQIYSVWKELYAAFLGKNGYGGTVAEIYAYRLVGNGDAKEFLTRPREEVAREAAETLTKLLHAFREMFPCEIGIQVGPNRFRPIAQKILPFDHRIHIEITPPKPKRDIARARRAIVELSKALEDSDLQPPEAQAWLERASDAICDIEEALFACLRRI